MNEIIVGLIILLVSCFGYLLVCEFKLVEDKWFSVGLSFGLGVGIISQELFLCSLLGIRWGLEILAIPWVILLLWIIFVKKAKLSLPFRISLKKTDWFIVLLILLALSYALFEAIIRPPVAWDSWAIWLLKSNIFFLDGKIIPQVLNYLHSDYPLILSLFGSFVYLVLGRIDDMSILLISFSFYFFLSLVFFASLNKQIGTRLALLFTFFLVTIQNLVRLGGRLEAGQADLPLGYFIFICTILLISYLKNFKLKTFIVLNIFLGICCLIKLEGIPFAILVEFLCLYRINQRNKLSHLCATLFWWVPLLSWLLYVKINRISGVNFSGTPILFSFSKTLHVLTSYLIEALNIKTWGILWVVYIYVVIIKILNKAMKLEVFDYIVLFQIFVYLMLYLFVSVYSPESSLSRLLTHVAPLALYAVAIHYSKSKRKLYR